MEKTDNYWELVHNTAIEGNYGYDEERGVWFLWRKADDYEYDIAVTVEDGRVVDAEAWNTNQVNEFLQENPVEIREQAPSEVVDAAMDPPIGDLVE